MSAALVRMLKHCQRCEDITSADGVGTWLLHYLLAAVAVATCMFRHWHVKRGVLRLADVTCQYDRQLGKYAVMLIGITSTCRRS